MITYKKRAKLLEAAMIKIGWDACTSRKVREYVEKLGFVYLDSGSGRIVFIHPRNNQCVFKVAHTDYCTKQNVQEWKMYNSATAIQKKYLARVRYKSPESIVLVMEHVSTMCTLKDKLPDFRKEVATVVGYDEDLHYGNIGRYKSGRLVVIDYGYA